ncbi:hypothetical protein HpNP14_15400 [Helicobacter pylori]
MVNILGIALAQKNIQFSYSHYLAHICLGILYTRSASSGIDETEILQLEKLDNITSVIKDFIFFAEEKWKIASDKGGSGNTANIGSIQYIDDILQGNGIFKNLGEQIFDEYWINQGMLMIPDLKNQGSFKKLIKLADSLEFKGIDIQKINPVKNRSKS